MSSTIFNNNSVAGLDTMMSVHPTPPLEEGEMCDVMVLPVEGDEVRLSPPLDKKARDKQRSKQRKKQQKARDALATALESLDEMEEHCTKHRTSTLHFVVELGKLQRVMAVDANIAEACNSNSNSPSSSRDYYERCLATTKFMLHMCKEFKAGHDEMYGLIKGGRSGGQEVLFNMITQLAEAQYSSLDHVAEVVCMAFFKVSETLNMEGLMGIPAERMAGIKERAHSPSWVVAEDAVLTEWSDMCASVADVDSSSPPPSSLAAANDDAADHADNDSADN